MASFCGIRKRRISVSPDSHGRSAGLLSCVVRYLFVGLFLDLLEARMGEKWLGGDDELCSRQSPFHNQLASIVVAHGSNIPFVDHAIGVTLIVEFAEESDFCRCCV